MTAQSKKITQWSKIRPIWSPCSIDNERSVALLRNAKTYSILWIGAKKFFGKFYPDLL
jgi:hypothetical protein